MQRVNRFARFWDMIGNSGRFRETLPIILGDTPFQRFLMLSDSLYAKAGSTWKISLKRIFELLYQVLVEAFDENSDLVKQSLLLDYQRAGQKSALDLGVANVRVYT